MTCTLDKMLVNMKFVIIVKERIMYVMEDYAM